MLGQMTIFDFIKPPEEERELDRLPENEMVAIVRNATNIPFEFVDGFWRYKAKIKGVEYSVQYSNYALDDNQNRFIACGYGNSKGGGGSPCDTIEEAVNYFKKAMERNR